MSKMTDERASQAGALLTTAMVFISVAVGIACSTIHKESPLADTACESGVFLSPSGAGFPGGSILYQEERKMITSIKKRDGRVVAFDPNKIEQAIEKSFAASGSQKSITMRLSRGHVSFLAAIALETLTNARAGKIPAKLVHDSESPQSTV